MWLNVNLQTHNIVCWLSIPPMLAHIRYFYNIDGADGLTFSPSFFVQGCHCAVVQDEKEGAFLGQNCKLLILSHSHRLLFTQSLTPMNLHTLP